MSGAAGQNGHAAAHHPHHPHTTTGAAGSNNFATVNSSFNEQLMNQTNFGFNPQRQTIVQTPSNNAQVLSHHK